MAGPEVSNLERPDRSRYPAPVSRHSEAVSRDLAKVEIEGSIPSACSILSSYSLMVRFLVAIQGMSVRFRLTAPMMKNRITYQEVGQLVPLYKLSIGLMAESLHLWDLRDWCLTYQVKTR